MFNIDNKFKVYYDDLFEISSNYHIFHFDDVPILYVGTNSSNHKILGSFIKEDYDKDTFYFFHVMITAKQFNSFIHGKKTYREILSESKTIFILEKDINDKLLSAYCLPFSLIPDDYLPLENTYCPNVENALGHEYSFSLIGLLADFNQALTNQVVSVSKSGEKIFKTILDSTGIKGLGYDVLQVPYTIGSFKINFKIAPKREKGVSQASIFHFENELHDYINAFISYSVNNLPEEAQKLGQKNIDNSLLTETVKKKLVAVYESSGNNFDLINDDKLIEAAISLSQEFETICDNLGKGFNDIEIISAADNGEGNSLAYIDVDFSTKNEVANGVIDILSNPTDEDPEFEEYEIQVYNLNTDKRKGNANVYNQIDKTLMDTPKITIEGDEELKGSKFTESMHLNKWIKVKAKASRSNDKVKFLKIKFEQ